jgi:hypothetical protein
MLTLEQFASLKTGDPVVVTEPDAEPWPAKVALVRARAVIVEFENDSGEVVRKTFALGSLSLPGS